MSLWFLSVVTDSRFQTSVEMISSSQEKKAEALLRSLLKEKPDDPQIRYYLALAFDRQRLNDSALYYFSKVCGHPDADSAMRADAFYQVAHIHADRGEHQLAVQNAARAVRIVFPHPAANLIKDILAYLTGSNNREALLAGQRGLTEVRNRNYEAGRKYFLQAIQIDSAWLGGAYELGIISYELGDYRSSLEYLDSVLQKIPFHASAHFEAARCHEKLGEKNKAAEHYRLFLNYNARTNPAFEQHALNFCSSQDVAGAGQAGVLPLGENIAPAVPDSTLVLDDRFSKGVDLLTRGHYQKAFKIFTQFSMETPSCGLWDYGKALIFLKKQNQSQSLMYLERALKLDPAIKVRMEKEPAWNRWRAREEFKRILQ